LEFNTALFDAATIQRMAAQFESLLAEIVQSPDAMLARLSNSDVPHREKVYAVSNAR
jgi:hypothetical protein